MAVKVGISLKKSDQIFPELLSSLNNNNNNNNNNVVFIKHFTKPQSALQYAHK